MNKDIIRMETEFANRKLVLETGRMAKQTNGSVFVQYGGTVVLVTATASDERREDIDYFPLIVDFIEKMYASGKIPGGFFKREAKPSTTATLTARLIDRPIRPLFPDGFRNEVQIIATVLSYDQVNSPEMAGMLGASAALSISDIPFHGPIAGVKVGLVDGEYIINPTLDELEVSDLDLSIAGKEEAIMMVESGAKEIEEDIMLTALDEGHKAIKELLEFEKEFIAKAAQPKGDYVFDKIDEELVKKIEVNDYDNLKEAVNKGDKKLRHDALKSVKDNIFERYEEKLGEEKFADKKITIKNAIEEIQKKVIREQVIKEKKRVDGRGSDDIRDITCEIDVLPSTHGAALFTRGETQSLGVVTLGSGADEKIIDELDEEFKKRFYLHYNFPPFSVGEVRFLRGPGRRELGHGNLAERALKPVIPDEEKFPYTLRIVSEILESNGSSSMATVCSGSLALMAAGVPIERPVVGIANGLIMEDDKYEVLTDILGIEDHYGDMDFKVTGSEKGITALQMDIKVEGITQEIMKDALYRAKEARNYILKKVKDTISEPRKQLSENAPKIKMFTVKTDKIGDIIGPQGKFIKAIIEETGVTIDIDDDGTVKIASEDQAMIDEAKRQIDNLVAEPEVGKIYEGTVRAVKDFGAFVEILPGQDGLVHISNLEKKRTKKTSDIVNVGDKVKVKVIKVENGKIQLSMKGLSSKE
ncbi:MAG: polyribonucleotide nucleotidyltransferase [Candidatus Cloacimonetes bacterium]|nr:polyribonucleotide nucleotidyltransferase [Candidatus Cloacimonadota bacterium]MBS3766850.1 polyribonucleotide nucleotidyltransferase [Candidatus Cloacimonadota bacterium]